MPIIYQRSLRSNIISWSQQPTKFQIKSWCRMLDAVLMLSLAQMLRLWPNCWAECGGDLQIDEQCWEQLSGRHHTSPVSGSYYNLEAHCHISSALLFSHTPLMMIECQTKLFYQASVQSVSQDLRMTSNKTWFICLDI